MKRIKQGMIFVVIGILMIQTVGCRSFRDKRKENTTQQEQQSQENEGIMTFGRSDSIVLDAEVDFKALKVEYFDDAVELYQDAELKNKIYCKYDWNEDNQTLSLLPPQYPVLNIATALSSNSLQHDFEHSDYYFFDKGAGNDWGNLGKMFLVKWMNLETGERLDEPEITEIHIKGEMDTPENFRFEVSEYGNAVLSWEEVEEAEKYLIIKAVYRTDELSGFFEECNIVAETTDTKWQSETENDFMNREFEAKESLDSKNEEYYYGVIAINSNGTSMVSSMLSKTEIAKRVPYCQTEKGNEAFDFKVFAKSLDLLPRFQWIQMCDGTEVQYGVLYETDKAEIVTITDWEEADKEMIQLPYVIEGTDFEGTFYVEIFDEDTYQKELEQLKERQEVLKSKRSGIITDIPITVEKETENEIEKGETQSYKEDTTNGIVATTELSGLFASCLMQGKEKISLAGISEKPSEEMVVDAFWEAYLQNPLIPLISRITLSESGEELRIFYEEDVKERKEKQKAVMNEVEFVAEQLDEEGMSDVEKVLAINAYLCDTITYAEEYADQIKTGEAVIGDSSTPYGALVNHKGVCIAYAGAFQLLAEKMGLDSLVVTGTSGNWGHAWNKVKINGKWCIVDATNNDNEDIMNAILNVSDDTAELMFKEDKNYLCDENLEQYKADTETFEYYHLADKYYEKDELADAFVKELTYGNKAVLRTDADLTNAEFQEMVNEVLEQMDEITLQGYYWLGVVYLERKN